MNPRPDGVPGHRTDLTRRIVGRPVGGVVAAATLPLLVALVKYIGTTQLFNADPSVFGINVADAAGGSFPSTGFYSRYGWSHPGPVAFYLFVPFHWLARGEPWGLLLGSFVWQIAAIGLSMWMAVRRARSRDARLALGAAAAAIQMLAWFTHPAATLLDPWTPIMATTLVVPFLLALWGLAEGDATAGATALVLGVIAAQIHVAFVLLCAVPLLVTAARGWTRRAEFRHRPLVVGLIVTGLSVLPIVIDVVIGRTGNVGELVRFFGRDAEHVGWARALRLVAAEFAPRPTWLGGPRLEGGFVGGTEASGWWLAAPIALLSIGAWRARRRHDRPAESLIVVSVAVLATSVVAAARIEGVVHEYLVRWRAPITVVVLFAIARALVPELRGRFLRSAAVIPVGTVVVASLAGLVQVIERPHLADAGESIEELVGVATAAAAERDVRVLVRQADGGYRGVYSTVMWSLVHEGIDARVDPGLTDVYGLRASTVEEVDEVWFVTDNGLAVSLLSALPGAELVALQTPFSPSEEATVTAAQRELDLRLVEAGRTELRGALDSPYLIDALLDIDGIDRATAARLGELNQRLIDEPRVGVVAFSSADAPDFYLPPPAGM